MTKITPEQYLKNKLIPKSTYNAVRFVDTEMSEYKLTHLLEEYADLKERQAYESGVNAGCIYSNKTQRVSEWSKHDYPTYEQWKESKAKEQ